MSELNECQRRMTVIGILRMWEKNLWTGSLLNEEQNELVYGISWGTLQGIRSLWPRTVQTIVSVWHPTGSVSSPSGVSAFEKALEQAVGEKANVKSLVSKRSLEVRDHNETVTREKVDAVLCIALVKTDLGDQCRLYERFGGVQTAVIRLTESDARSLLGLGKLRVGWVNYRIREHVEFARCFRCQGYGHVSRGCALPGTKDACWRCGGASHVAKECTTGSRCLTCADRGEKDVHASGSGSCP